VGEGVLMEAGKRESGEAGRDALLADAGITRAKEGLVMAGVPLAQIAREVGTPAFVYNAEAIRRQFRALESAFASIPHRVCYAVKANSNLAVLRLMHDLGAGADLVSAGEMRRAVAAGFSPRSLVFSGVGKTVAELEETVSAGIGQVNVESLEELRLLGAVAARLDRITSVGIRVNPDVTTDTHPYISTSHGGIKFGVPHDQVRAAADYLRDHPYLRLTAVAMHLGSQLLDPAPYAEALGKLVALVKTLRAAGVSTLESLDIGGGLGIRYQPEAGPGMDPAALAAVVGPLAAEAGLPVTMEPGRFLVGSAGVLLTEVLYRKHSGGRDFVIVDAAMNDLLRPSLYRAHHEIVEVAPAGRPAGAVDVVGPICETGDFLALERTMPRVEPGERLAVLCAGAYGFAMSSNYNTRGRVAEVLVDGGRSAVVRPREPVDSLFASEVADPFATLSDNG
jgi:diaminopimelate decarboxylase